MALSGTFGNTFRTGYRVQIDWSATQSIVNNQSTITLNFYLVSLGSSYTINSSATKDGFTSIGGTSEAYSGAGLANLTGNQKKLLNQQVRTVTHNSNGTLSLDLVGSFDIEVTLGGTFYGTVSASSPKPTELLKVS